MIWLILLVIITYFRTLFNAGISDDISVHSELRNKGFPIRWKELDFNPFYPVHDFLWKVFKNKWVYHHIVNMLFFMGLVCSFYFVAQKWLPENVVFLASVFFTVHPCNAQVGGWISGKHYGITLILGLWALYFNNVALYILTALFAPNMLALPLLMNISLPVKILAIALYLLLVSKSLNSKGSQVVSEGEYKKDNLKFYPRKLIVALKSFCNYFCLAFLPLRMGWFHELGEPIDKKMKAFNFHAILCVLLIASMFLFYGTPAFLGLAIFALFIAPFSNILSFGLFTSERYMCPALIGWSIFLAYITISYPIVATVIITAYFMRTQLELWAYRDDFTLALYSLLNFNKSGFAWCNLANYFLTSRRPSAAFDTLQESVKRLPEFPTHYYQLYLMYRAVDLLCDFDKALEYLEKACHYGKHEAWYKELETFKEQLKAQRIKKFKESCVTKYPTIRQFRPSAQPDTQDIGELVLGAASLGSY